MYNYANKRVVRVATARVCTIYSDYILNESIHDNMFKINRYHKTNLNYVLHQLHLVYVHLP